VLIHSEHSLIGTARHDRHFTLSGHHTKGRATCAPMISKEDARDEFFERVFQSRFERVRVRRKIRDSTFGTRGEGTARARMGRHSAKTARPFKTRQTVVRFARGNEKALKTNPKVVWRAEKSYTPETAPKNLIAPQASAQEVPPADDSWRTGAGQVEGEAGSSISLVARHPAQPRVFKVDENAFTLT